MNNFEIKFDFSGNLTQVEKYVYNNTYIGIKDYLDDEEATIIYCFSIIDWAIILNINVRELYNEFKNANQKNLTVKETFGNILKKTHNTSMRFDTITYIPYRYMKYNHVDKYEESIHD